MNNKNLATVLFLIMASSLSLLLVEPANAQVPTPPDVPTLGPIIICDQGNYLNVSSPQNRTYPNNPIQLTFTITVSTMLGQFGNVGYSIDGEVVTSIRNLPTTETRPDPQSGLWYYYTETASAILDLPQLTDGAHNVTVYYGWQYLGVPQNPSLQRFEVYAYQTVNFTIGKPQPTPSPKPSPTPSPTQLPTINTGPETREIEPLPTTIIAAVIIVVVLAVAAALLVYFKKHKSK